MVKDITITQVMTAAVNTMKKSSTIAQIVATTIDSKKVKANKKYKLFGTLRAAPGIHTSINSIASVITRQNAQNQIFDVKNLLITVELMQKSTMTEVIINCAETIP